ncbi:GDSL-type esterase/lipase family protein [Peribacillus sp. SCS-26]|uniref:GDSL-type esterase/lipase family protein n=1 Tax=Paraperibacillus marinus TaxID=3115295 RepID=UPI00390601B9
MKFIKIILAALLLAALSLGLLLYYPDYQLNKLKAKGNEEQTMTAKNHSSYLDYYKNSPKSQISHLALGDSVIKGYGSNDGHNLVSDFSTELGRMTGKSVTYQNEGINGITSATLRSLIEEGTFDEQIKNADLITLNIGGNDLLKAASASRDIYEAIKTFNKLQSSFTDNLTAISAHITALNPEAAVLMLELYNPLPEDSPFYSLGSKLLPQWNLMIYEASSKMDSAVVIETTRVINGRNIRYLSPDGIHPNSEGYAAISKQMIHQLEKRTSPLKS